MNKKTSQPKENLPYNPEITEQDKKMLRDDKNIHNDDSADRELLNRNKKVDFAGKDLDIPGRTEAQKGNGVNGLNDEENKLHSQGGERNNNLERDNATK